MTKDNYTLNEIYEIIQQTIAKTAQGHEIQIAGENIIFENELLKNFKIER